RYGFGMQSPITLYPIVIGTTIIWLIVTYLTRPTDEKVLEKFYRQTHPGGIGWRALASRYPDIKSDTGFGRLFLDWAAGVVLVYASLFGIGKLLFAEYLAALGYLALGAVAAATIYLDLRSRGFETIAK
ncbi:MAG: sodium:proline symporter, partial [Candidatus Marinimicrobia bacterium]|nr:sodium:proline symporter [Candidatus Neomarinimicrobiota bacterium]